MTVQAEIVANEEGALAERYVYQGNISSRSKKPHSIFAVCFFRKHVFSPTHPLAGGTAV